MGTEKIRRPVISPNPQGEFGLLTGGSYSSSEVDTGWKWIDRRTIYRKVVNFGQLPNATIKNVAHGITGMDVLIDTSAIANDPSANGWLPLPRGTALGDMTWSLDATNVGVQTTANRTNYTECFFVLLYVKV